jgi:hypothetical protein
VQLPSGPIAEPAVGRTTLSRIEVGVVPYGTITNDGQALPLVSPDGRFIAVQQGEAPTWEVLLAEPGAHPPLRTGITVFQVGERTLTRVEQALPAGLVLGRASDDRGFLVEAPQPDGSRWIGRVSWVGGLQWLVQGNMVNSAATLTPRGDLLYTRRALESNFNDLVIQSPDGQPSVRPADGGSYEFPLCTSDLSLVYALRLSEKSGIELEVIRLDRGGAADGPARLTATISSKVIEPKADRLQAYQITAGAPPVIPARTGFIGGDSALAIFHPRMGRMAAYRLENGQFDPLAPASMSAIPSQDSARPGFYCTTAEGMVFVPSLGKPGVEAPTIRVLPSAYVGRRLSGTPESMMLFGPVKGRADEMEVVKLVIGPTSAPQTPN